MIKFSFIVSYLLLIISAVDNFDEVIIDTISNNIQFERRKLNDITTTIIERTDVTLSDSMDLIYDPPSGHFSPTALGVYAAVSGKYSATAIVYYSFDSTGPSFSSSYITFTSPYIEVDTPFGQSRERTLSIVAVQDTTSGYIRSQQYTLTYYVESLARPYSYGFFVPGLETSGYFLRVGLEMVATARAQAVGNQEFADFFNKGSKSTLGTYKNQIEALHLPSLDPDLTGFQGGYAVNTSDNSYYGILVPYHNGNEFFGKVVRVNLTGMANSSSCMESYRMESLSSSGEVIYSGLTNATDACIVVLDLSTVHAYARGFLRGFVGYPYVYLSPGEFEVAVRLDMENFGIETVSTVNFGDANSELGGFSGGFVDGSWACFSPMRTFYGPVGGLRSTLPVDKNQLRPYYHSQMVCVNSTGWDVTTNLSYHIRTFNPARISTDYRGFSDAIRIGRYAYLCPYASDSHSYDGKLVRIYLGPTDIGTQIDALTATGAAISTITDVLDLAQVNSVYAGFSGFFTGGQYLFLVPYRNSYSPSNGQRGHGNIVKLNLNDFSVSGVTGLDLTVTTRNQIPSFADTNLRGFSYGFASGKYGIYVPYYSGTFSGRCARVQLYGSYSLSGDLQELDFAVDRNLPNTFVGFTGAFVSIWPGTAS